MHQKDKIGEDMILRDARRREAEMAWREHQRELWCKEEELSPKTKEEINNVRTKLFWVYQTRDPNEFKVRFVAYFLWILRELGKAEALILINIMIDFIYDKTCLLSSSFDYTWKFILILMLFYVQLNHYIVDKILYIKAKYSLLAFCLF